MPARTSQPLPDGLARSVLAYVGCVAGAISVAGYEQSLRGRPASSRFGSPGNESAGRAGSGARHFFVSTPGVGMYWPAHW
jgi:hypothetical protein